MVSETKVQRDPLYTGNVIWEPCAVVLRLAPTFFRFGSFEIFKERDKYSGMTGPCVGLKLDMMPKMLEYVIKNHYPDIYKTSDCLGEKQYQMFFEEITKRTAKMVAHW